VFDTGHEYPACNKCAGNDLSLNGSIYFNHKTGLLEVGNIFDEVYCHTCDRDVNDWGWRFMVQWDLFT